MHNQEFAICCLLGKRNFSEDIWCELLGFIEFAVNSAVAEGTGQVPAELTIGELPRSPLDVVVQAVSHVGAGDFVQHVYVLLECARDHLEKTKEY